MDDRREAIFHGRYIKVSDEAHSCVDVIGSALRLKLVEKPKALLSK
jgi:hypothetical protein